MSLLEGLMSGVVLAFGLLAALQGFIFASQQNSSAAKMTRATSVASQLRSALQTRTRAQLRATVLSSGNCTTNGVTTALAGKLFPVPSGFTGCVVDLDAVEALAATPAVKVVPGVVGEDAATFRRAILYISGPTAGFDQLQIIVSWNDVGQRRFLQQSLALYDPAVNGAGVEL